MKKYTLILIVPDYIASSFGSDFEVLHVEADTFLKAVAEGQKLVAKGVGADPSDYALVAGFEGWQRNLA